MPLLHAVDSCGGRSLPVVREAIVPFLGDTSHWSAGHRSLDAGDMQKQRSVSGAFRYERTQP
jgi:hypothetical protein